MYWIQKSLFSKVIFYKYFWTKNEKYFSASELWTNYEQAKSWLRCKKLPPDIDMGGVFCNDTIGLDEVEIYGYDYDYTLASYKKGVEYLIHDIAKEHLVKKYGYPEDIAKIVYDPHFPIRGEKLKYWCEVELDVDQDLDHDKLIMLERINF